jgi:hypothetical protein
MDGEPQFKGFAGKRGGVIAPPAVAIRLALHAEARLRPGNGLAGDRSRRPG